MWLGDQITVFFNNMLAFFGIGGRETAEYSEWGGSDAFTGLPARIAEIIETAAEGAFIHEGDYFQGLADDISATGLETDFVMPGSEGYGGGGAGASYTSGRNLTINIEINTDVIAGEGGIRQLAVMLRDEIYSAEELGY